MGKTVILMKVNVHLILFDDIIGTHGLKNDQIRELFAQNLNCMIIYTAYFIIVVFNFLHIKMMINLSIYYTYIIFLIKCLS